MSLVIKNLSKSFGKKQIFSDFSFNFADAGAYTIQGESGIGKTTLLRIIAGLDTDYSGTVEGGGINKVAFAFQEYRLFTGITAIQNVVFAISGGKDKAVYEIAKKMLLSLGFNEEDINLFPDELSGGMKQRVSLARAFLADRSILLLDEPTKELDPSNAEAVREIIRKVSKDKIVIIVSHSGEDLNSLSATPIEIKKC